MTSLIGRVAELQDLRLDAASVAAVLKERRASFDNENANLIALVREKSAAVQSAETALKAVALEAYAENGVRTPAPGVEIKVFREYQIDEEKGLAWAKAKELCLIPASLDIAAVKKFASVQHLPFVKVGEVPRAQIATDLSKVDLTKAPAAAVA